MIPTIIVFVSTPCTVNQSTFINRLLKSGYGPLVDSVHQGDNGWLAENTKCPHILYNLDENISCGFEETGLDMQMDVLVAFNWEVEISSVQWKEISKWLAGDLQELEWLEKPVVAPVVQQIKNTDLLGEEPELVTYPDCYGFRQFFKDNVGFFEITKPNTDRPFTTYVEKYSENGKDLFSNFFISTAWGVARDDLAFLKELWKWKMMDTGEELDCEKLLKERIERCQNGEPEPRVYRKSLEDVMEIYVKITAMVGEKRQRQNGESSRKRFTETK
jgi:hypothetical protein